MRLFGTLQETIPALFLVLGLPAKVICSRLSVVGYFMVEAFLTRVYYTVRVFVLSKPDGSRGSAFRTFGF